MDPELRLFLFILVNVQFSSINSRPEINGGTYLTVALSEIARTSSSYHHIYLWNRKRGSGTSSLSCVKGLFVFAYNEDAIQHIVVKLCVEVCFL